MGLKINWLRRELSKSGMILSPLKFWTSLPNSKNPSSDNKRYTRLKEAITEPLTKKKVKFFAAVAKSLNSFFVEFHTDNLMGPFLAQSIEEIIGSYASLFLLKQTLSNATSCPRLSKFCFKDSAKQKCPVYVERNVGVKLELSHLQKNGKVSTN